MDRDLETAGLHLVRRGLCWIFVVAGLSLVTLDHAEAQGPLDIEPGTLYFVVGVRPDDVLNMRSAPNPRARIIKTIRPFSGPQPLPATGRSEKVGSSAWMEIVFQGEYGWVNARFLTKGQGSGDATGAVKKPRQQAKHFGVLTLRPLSGDLSMQVVDNFGFVDSNGVRWEVPPGAKTDGASIPRWAWSFVGGPFAGKYRDAAVIHDYFCGNRNRPWRDTHRVFYDAMRISGVGNFLAKVMYISVYRFGPRWYRDKSVCWGTCAGDNVHIEDVVITPRFDSSEFNAIREYINRFPDVSIEQIEKFADANSDASNQLDSARVRGTVSDERTGQRRFIDENAPINWMSLD